LRAEIVSSGCFDGPDSALVQFDFCASRSYATGRRGLCFGNHTLKENRAGIDGSQYVACLHPVPKFDSYGLD
jgi:hypothetical protein